MLMRRLAYQEGLHAADLQIEAAVSVQARNN
jgi:hypothetical protein